MKKIILLILGIILIGINVYAAGDLQVNGTMGIGTTPNSNIKLAIIGTNAQGGFIQSTTDSGTGTLYSLKLENNLSGTATGLGYGIALISNISSDASNVLGGLGASFITALGSDNAGTTTIDTTAAGIFDTVMNPGNHNYNVTTGYGFLLKFRDFRWEKTGTYHYNDYFNLKINNATSDYGALSVDNLSGVWIEKQTLGGTANYGIVLNGDGAGADIVFGPAQEASIYSSGGELFAKDGAGNVTQISPHDPETGEWRFYSKNIKTGRVVEVNMEKLVKAVEKLTGETFMIETLVTSKE